MDISFKTKEMEAARSFSYDMPENFDALVAKFGQDAVFAAAKGSFVISLQALGRRHLDKTDEEITALAKDWNPNERSAPTKKSAFEKATSALSQLSPEEKKELIARLRAG